MPYQVLFTSTSFKVLKSTSIEFHMYILVMTKNVVLAFWLMGSKADVPVCFY